MPKIYFLFFLIIVGFGCDSASDKAARSPAGDSSDDATDESVSNNSIEETISSVVNNYSFCTRAVSSNTNTGVLYNNLKRTIDTSSHCNTGINVSDAVTLPIPAWSDSDVTGGRPLIIGDGILQLSTAYNDYQEGRIVEYVSRAAAFYSHAGDNVWLYSDRWRNSDTPYSRAVSDGNRIAAYSITEDAVFVFEKIAGGSWTRQKLSTGEYAPRHTFGFQIAIDGDRVVVAQSPDPFAGSCCENRAEGALYVFERNESGSWPLTGKIIPKDPQALLTFGSGDIDISGDRIVALVRSSTPEEPVSTLHLFERTISNEWKENTIVPANGGDLAGGVAVNNNWIAAGSILSPRLANPVEFDTPGMVHLFKRDSTGRWIEIQLQPSNSKNIEDNEYASHELNFGQSVLLETGVLVVQGPGNPTTSSDQNAVFIYKLNENGIESEAIVSHGDIGYPDEIQYRNGLLVVPIIDFWVPNFPPSPILVHRISIE